MPTILLILCIVMIAEIDVIIQIIWKYKNSTPKPPYWGAFFPIIYYLFILMKESGERSDHLNNMLLLSLKKGDEKFKNSDCFSLISDPSANGINTNKERDDLKNAINNCYDDVLSLLSDILTYKELYICVLHHLNVQPQKIGDILHISYATVRTHKSRIKIKLSEANYNLFFSSDHNSDTTNQ